MSPVLAAARRAKARARPEGRVARVGMQDLPALARRLAGRPGGPDPYLSSAAYYGFTGRHGLWTYEEDGDFIPFCAHPNVPGKTLIFPSASANGIALARNLLSACFTPGDAVQLARLTPRAAEEAVTRLSWTTQGYRYEIAEERVLDWLFPVHTLSTERVAAHRGGAFNAFRGRLYQADRARARVEALDIGAHYADLLSLSRRWAEARATPSRAFGDLFAPNAYILRMARESGLDLRGSVIYMDGACVSCAIWEMPPDRTRPASSVMMLAHGASKGLSELQQLERCRALRDDGIARVCIGGSETAGLDAHKRKLSPVESLPLVSVAVGARDAGRGG